MSFGRLSLKKKSCSHDHFFPTSIYTELFHIDQPELYNGFLLLWVFFFPNTNNCSGWIIDCCTMQKGCTYLSLLKLQDLSIGKRKPGHYTHQNCELKNNMPVKSHQHWWIWSTSVTWLSYYNGSRITKFHSSSFVMRDFNLKNANPRQHILIYSLY